MPFWTVDQLVAALGSVRVWMSDFWTVMGTLFPFWPYLVAVVVILWGLDRVLSFLRTVMGDKHDAD